MNSGQEDESVGTLPRVSVGMPLYNAERFLEQAIGALLSQTYGDFEIVISDNGSTDGTEELCLSFAAMDGRVRYYRSERNRGLIWNFNRVFELASGEYFKWASYDDVCAPTFLERCVGVLDQDTGIVCCHALTEPIDASGTTIPHEVVGSSMEAQVELDASSPSPQRRFHDVLLSSGFEARCYGVIRTEVLRRTGMLRTVYGYEKVLMAELALHGRFHDVPEPLFFLRYHDEMSGNIETAEGQQEFVAPESGQRKRFPRLHLLMGYVGAIRRSPIQPSDRLLCLMWVGHYLLQVRKWKRVLWSALRGRGTGGRLSDVIQRLEDRDPDTEVSGVDRPSPV